MIKNKKIFCFDIDNVICTTKGRDYLKALPKKEVIKIINKLYEEGHYIKIFTARYMGRNNDNIKYSTLSIATPYPGTELAEMAIEGRHGLELKINDETKFLRYFSPTMQMNDLSMTYLKIMQIIGLIWMHFTPVKIVGSIKRFGFFRIGLTALMTSLMLLKVVCVDWPCKKIFRTT